MQNPVIRVGTRRWYFVQEAEVTEVGILLVFSGKIMACADLFPLPACIQLFPGSFLSLFLVQMDWLDPHSDRCWLWLV